ncbi:MAG: hypothetical protein ACREU7_13490 [Burkholderiales bacterium]
MNNADILLAAQYMLDKHGPEEARQRAPCSPKRLSCGVTRLKRLRGGRSRMLSYGSTAWQATAAAHSVFAFDIH